MRRALPALLLAALVVCSGCVGVPSVDPGTDTRTVTPTTTDRPTTVTDQQSAPTRTDENVSVRYGIHAGEIPDEFRSLNVTLEVVFVADHEDLGPCYREVYNEPADPTPTPQPDPPEDDCYRFGEDGEGDGVTLDLTEIEQGTTISPFSAPTSVDGGHALLLMGADGTLENGTAAKFPQEKVPLLQVTNSGPDEPARPSTFVQGGFDRQYDVTINVEADEFGDTNGPTYEFYGNFTEVGR